MPAVHLHRIFVSYLLGAAHGGSQRLLTTQQPLPINEESDNDSRLPLGSSGVFPSTILVLLPQDHTQYSLSPLPTVLSTRKAFALVLLKKVAGWDGISEGISEVLTTAFGAEDYLDCVRNLEAHGIEPLSYIDNLDKVDSNLFRWRYSHLVQIWRQITDSLPPDSDLRNRCIRALSGTCELYETLPTSYAIPFTLTKPGPTPFKTNGLSYVWRLTDEGNFGQVFAVRSYRFEGNPIKWITQDGVGQRLTRLDFDQRLYAQMHCKEVVLSKRLNHPNVLSIEGVAPKLFEFSMVAQWMPNGALLGYVRNYSDANRLELVSSKYRQSHSALTRLQLIGVTRGLEYLHDNGIVHGNLRSVCAILAASFLPKVLYFLEQGSH